MGTVATLKYRLEDEQIAAFVAKVRNLDDNDDTSTSSAQADNFGFALPMKVGTMTDQATAETDDVDNIGPHKGEP